MSRAVTPVILATLAAASLWLTPPVWAASSTDASAPVAKPPVPGSAPTWGHPPDAVRTALAALHDACAAWPKQIPIASEPPSSLPAEADEPYMLNCSRVLDPEGSGQLSLLQGGALGAAAAGIAAVVFKLLRALLSGLSGVTMRGLAALSERRRHRVDGWPG